ncbi:MAG: aldo/keto reductase [Alphaproteobacteria bacterium]|nr:aldo/keto reductase [Alphaproteobacteria bacterium]
MDKIELGQTGILVSRLGLGTVKFGRNEGVKYPQAFDLPEDYTLLHLLSVAKELGINVLDTAPAYGLAEERLGKLLQGQRHEWVIASKAGEEFENGKSSYNFTPDHFSISLERSLKRLQTDYLDVLLIHSDGNDLKILSDEKLLAKLGDFKKQGMVRAVGASTKTVEGGLKVAELLDVVMCTYNPAHTEEKPVLDYAAQNKKGILLKKALQSGHSTDIPAVMDFAFSHPAVSSVITGTINPEHLRQNVQAARSALSSSAG